MSVLFILTDQHNASFIGCHGGTIRTPDLDELALEGMVFERVYTPSPVCVPARACLFSGRYVHENSCWDNRFPYNGDEIPGWGHYFRKKGVNLATIGKLDFTAGADCGVDSVHEPDNRTSYSMVSPFREVSLLLRSRYHMVNNWDVSLREIGEHLEQNIVGETRQWFREEMPKDRPWILNVSFSKPHSPWHPLPEKYRHYRDRTELPPKYRRPEYELSPVDREQSRHTCGSILDEEHLKNYHAAYHATAEEHDKNVGAVIRALKETGQHQDTLIICSADHGEMLRAHDAWEKSTMYEDFIRAPMIVKSPGVGTANGRMAQEAGGRARAPVFLLNIFPTINELLGFEKQDRSHGDSLVPLVWGISDGEGRYVVPEFYVNGRITGTYATIKDQRRLVYYDGYGKILSSMENGGEEMNNLTEKAESGTEVRKKIEELQNILGDESSLHKISQEAFYV